MLTRTGVVSRNLRATAIILGLLFIFAFVLLHPSSALADELLPQGESAPPPEEELLETPGGASDGETPMLFAGTPDADDSGPEGLGETAEPYSVPAGSAYVKEVGDDVTYINNSVSNAIQKAVEDAVTYAFMSAEKSATIVVANGVYQDGISIDNSENSELSKKILDLIALYGGSAEDIKITIAAADALNEDGSPNANSAGGVRIEGGIYVEGLDVILAGLYFSTRGIVEAKNAGSISYYGTTQDDDVQFNFKNISGEIEIDAGGGDDTLSVSIAQDVTVSATVSKELYEAVKDLPSLDSVEEPALAAEIQSVMAALQAALLAASVTSLKATVKGGAGDDDIFVKLVNSSNLETFTPKEGDSVHTLKFDVSKTALSVLGGSGSDRIEVAGGMALKEGSALINAIASDLPSGFTLEENEIAIDGGAGDDVITVDTTAAVASFAGTRVTLTGGTGYDRLHLSGTLDKNAAEAERISGDARNLSLKALTDIVFLGGTDEVFTASYRRVMSIVSDVSVEALTDALMNKREIELSSILPNAPAALQSFTDYVYAPVSGVVDFSSAKYASLFTGTAGVLLLSNFVVRGASLRLVNLYAPALNLLVIADTLIEVAGTAVGKNILLLIDAGDKKALDVDVDIDVPGLIEEGLGMDDEEGGGPDITIELDFEVYGAKAEVGIRIGAGANLTASEAIALLCSLTLDKAYLPLLEGKTEPFLLKIGKSSIEILGSLTAGGSISALSQLNIAAEAMNGALKAIVPIAVATAVAESSVTAGGNAALNAGTGGNGGALLRAKNFISVKSEAMAGALKIAIALSVVEAKTLVNVGENAAVNACGDVTLKADSVIVLKAVSTGKPADVAAEDPKSGGFAAGSFVFSDTSASVTGGASITSGGCVRVASRSIQDVRTIAVSIPAAESTGTPSLIGSVKLIEKILGVPKAGNQSFFGKILAGATGSNSLGNKFTDATKSAAPETPEQKSTTQAMGSLSIAYLSNKNKAVVDTTGSIQASGALALHAFASTVSYARADGSLYQTPPLVPGAGGTIEQPPDNAVGVGVVVAVLDYNNEALIKKGTIRASGLNVTADAGYTASSAIAKAGHVPATAKIGIGGAVAVHIVTIKNNAAIGSGAACTLTGGGVAVAARGRGAFITVADASGKRTTPSVSALGVSAPLKPTPSSPEGSVGVGAGIAVGVTGIDIAAVIEEGAKLLLAENATLESVLVKAEYGGNERVDAAAGAAGGTSIVPVLALGVSGLNVEAAIGAAVTAITSLGDVDVLAIGSMTRVFEADAAAAGSGVGVGAALAVSILNDSASAKLLRSVTARNVRVKASSVSRVTETVKASAVGATPPSGSGAGADAQPGSGKQDDIEKIEDGDDPLDDDGEVMRNLFNEGEADALADKNTNAATGLAENANTKNVNKESISTLAKQRPGASTSEGSVQVAAGLALNIQSNYALAMIGDGLIVIAVATLDGKNGEASVISLNDTDASIAANASATNSTTGVGVAVAINLVKYGNRVYLGDSRISAASLTLKADILEAGEKATVEKILSALMDFLADTQSMNLLLDALAKVQKEGETFDQQITEALGEDATEANKNAVKAKVIEVLVAKMKDGQTLDVANALFAEVIEGFLEKFKETLCSVDFLVNLLKGSDESMENPLKELVDVAAFKGLLKEIALVSKASLQRVRAAVVQALAVRFGNESELTGVGHTISTTAISGVGAANVGVAGSAAITVIDGVTEAVVADRQSLINDDIVITGGVTISAESAQKVYTTASASADKTGKAIKNKNGQESKDEKNANNNASDVTNGTGTSSKGTSVGIGASAAIAIINAEVHAGLGKLRTLLAATLGVTAVLQNDIDTIAVSGADPLARRDSDAVKTAVIGSDPEHKDEKAKAATAANNTSTKDISVDAAVALGMIHNKVTAFVAEGTRVMTTGGNTIETGRVLVPASDGKEAVMELLNLFVYALQKGQTYTGASGFAIAGKAAVGAAVAVNLASSDVQALFLGSGQASGKAKVEALTYNEDESAALATVVGASLDRMLDKLRSAFRLLSFQDTAPTGSMNAKIVDKLNGFVAPAVKKTDQAASESKSFLPLSSNILKVLNIKLPGTSDTKGTSTANNAANNNTTGGATGQPANKSTEDGQKLNIAAAVAVNVTNHKALAKIMGTISAANVAAIAENRGNFRTLGTGLTATVGDTNSNNISVGAAVTVNANEAVAHAGGSITARGEENKNDGDITVSSTLTQNMDGAYRGLLGAQALAGSISGSGGKVGFAGAAAVMVARAKSIASIFENAVLNGGAVTLSASDKSKLAVRAGSVTVGGSKVSIGASFAVVYAENTVSATVGDNAAITAKRLTIEAVKLRVDSTDYALPFGIEVLFTVDAKESTRKGLVNLKTKEGSGHDGMDIAIDTADLLKVIDLMNFLSSVNYYVEAIAGTIAAGESGTLALSGSVAAAFINNVITASAGKNVRILLTGGEEADLTVNANSETNSRLIGGSLSGSNAKAGVGLNIAMLADGDKVYALIGDGAEINTDGDVLLCACAKTDVWAITAAASITTGGNGAAIGGNLNVIVTGNEVRAEMAENAAVTAGGRVSVTAENGADLTLIAVSISGGSNKAAVGGTVAVIVSENGTYAKIGGGSNVRAQKSITVKALSREELLSILASASGSTGAAVAGTLGVTVSESNTMAEVGSGTKLTAVQDGIDVLADSTVRQILILAAAAGGGGQVAAGAAVNVLVFSQKAIALVADNADLRAGGTIRIQALGNDWTLIVTAAGAAGTSNVTVAGAIPVVVTNSVVRAQLGSNARAEADDTVAVMAHLTANLYTAAGGFAFTSGQAGIGATLSTLVLQNTVEALVGDFATIIGHAVKNVPAGEEGVQLLNRDARRRGVVVRATASSQLLMASVSGAFAAGTAAVAGVVNTLVYKNSIQAKIGNHVAVNADAQRSADGTILSASPFAGDGAAQDIIVEAEDESQLFNIAGGVAASAGTAGVGATAVVLVYNNKVSAMIGGDGAGNTGAAYAVRDMIVAAKTTQDVYMIAFAFGAAGTVGVAGGVNVLVFENAVSAALGGSANAGGSIEVSAASKAFLINAAAAAAGSGTAAVTGVAVVTYFYNSTLAYVRAGAKLAAHGDVKITASSQEFVSADAAGVSGSGTAAVGGTLDVIVSKVVTKAYTESGVEISGKNISVSASDTFEVLAIVATLAVSGTVGVGVTVIAAVFYNTVSAEVGYNNRFTAAQNILVSAASNRTANVYAFAAGGGEVGVGGTIAVLVAGSKLTEDAHGGIYATNGGYSAMDPQKQVDGAFGQGHSAAQSSKPKESLTDLLASDGQKAGDVGVDGGNYGQGGYDADSAEPGVDGDLYDETAGSSRPKPQGANIGGYALTDATSALVRSGSELAANAGGIEVLASDTLHADLIAGTLAGGIVGVGLGISVAVLFSNVQAVVESGAELSAAGAIRIKATAGASEAPITNIGSEEEGTKAVNDRVKSDATASTSSTIRLISVTGSGGLVGVSVAVAALVMFTEAHAVLAGDVTRALSVSVTAVSDFGEVLAVTLAAGGGAVSVNGSVAVVYYEGTAEASISGTAKLQNISSSISVRTEGESSALAVAAAMSGGAGAINAGVAVAINRTRIDTFIGTGVTITAPLSALSVGTDFTAQAKAAILSVALGGMAVGVTVAIVVNRPVVLTYIGTTPYGKVPLAGSAGTGGLIEANAATIENSVSGNVRVYGFGVAAGSTAINGAVALGFNRVIGYAYINKANITANAITVTALMSGDTTVIVTALVGGAVGVGATVAVSQIETDNRAGIDITGASVNAGTVRVQAGKEGAPYDSQALTSVITGVAGMGAGTVNLAIAVNGASNRALITGSSGSLMATGALHIYANGNTRAYAIIAAASVGGFAGNASVSTAILSSVQEAMLTSDGTVEAGSLSAVSDQNTNYSTYGIFELLFDTTAPSAVKKVELKFSAMAQAYIFSATVGAAAIYASAATAIANATGRAEVTAKALLVTGDIVVTSNGRSVANAKVDNLSAGFVNLGIVVGYAYAKGVFEALLASNGSITAKNITVSVLYTANALTELTPALGGVDVGYYSGKLNTAFADVRTIANAGLSGGGAIKAKAVGVYATGEVNATAKINTPSLSLSAVRVAANLVFAALNAVQTAAIQNVQIEADSVSVTSSLNHGHTDADALAEIGGNGFVEGVVLSLVGAEANAATASVNAKNYAFAENAGFELSGTLSIKALSASNAKAKVEGDNANISLIGVGVLVMTAEAKGEFKAYLSTGVHSIKVGALSVESTYTASADAVSTQPNGGFKISLVNVEGNAAVADAGVNSSAYITGSGVCEAAGNIFVKATGSAAAKAEVQAAGVSVSGVNIAANIAKARLTAVQNAYIGGGAVTSRNGSVEVVSSLLGMTANATVGSNAAGAGVSLADGGLSLASSVASMKGSAYIENSAVTAAKGKVRVEAAARAANIRADSLSAKVSISGAKIGVVRASTDVTSVIKAYIDGNSTVVAKRVEVLAEAVIKSEANANPPSLSVALASGNSVEATAGAGIASPMTVEAYIGAGSDVTATGAYGIDALLGILVQAISLLTLEARAADSVDIGGIQLGKYSVLARANAVNTTAYIAGKAVSYDDIGLVANSVVNTSAYASVKGGGFLSGGSNTSETRVTQNAAAEARAGAELIAHYDITLQAKTASRLYASIAADAYGAGVATKMEALNTLTRSTNAKIGDGAKLISDAGNIWIEALADLTDIDSVSTGFAGAAGVAGDGPLAKITVTSDTLTTVGSGAVIETVGGQLDIRADALSDLYAYAYRRAVAFAGGNRSEAVVQTTENSKVLISENGAEKARILGRLTTIGAYISAQKVMSHAVSYTGAAGSNTRADATTAVYNTVTTLIDNAYVGGVETLEINAMVLNMNITAKTYSEIVGVTGWVFATSDVHGYSNAKIIVTGKGEVAGPMVSLTADSPVITDKIISRNATAVANTIVSYVWEKTKQVIKRIVSKVSKIPFIGWLIKKIVETIIKWIDVLVKYVFYSDAEQVQTGTFTSNGSIVFNGSAHIGGAAAGMYLTIYEDGQYRLLGLDQQKTAGSTVIVENEKVTVDGLFNDDLGSFILTALNGSVTGSGKVYTNNFLPNVVINNYSDRKLVIRDLTLYNGTTDMPNIQVNSDNRGFTYLFGDETPALTVNSYGGGDVEFIKGLKADTDVGEGSITLNMYGGSAYTGGGAFVTANRFVINGAKNVGAKALPFRAYIFEVSTYGGIPGVNFGSEKRETYVSITASGDLSIELGLVVLWMTEAQEEAASGNLGTLNLNGLYAGGEAEITLLAPQSFNAKRSIAATVIDVALPRHPLSLTRITETSLQLPDGESEVELLLATDGSGTGYFLTRDGLITRAVPISFNAEQYYTELMSGGHDYKYYTLPNGAVVVTDALTGRLISVVTREHNADAPEPGTSYSFEGVNVERDASGNVVSITFTGSGAAYDQKITFKDGKAVMEIGENGATMYIESTSSLGWTLPNGIRIYYKQVFIGADGKVVDGAFITNADGNGARLLVLENLNGSYDANYLFHVVKVTVKDGAYTFVEGYTYTREQLAQVMGGSLALMQTLDEAKTAVQGELAKLTAAALQAEYQKASGTDEQKAKALADYIAGLVSAVVGKNLSIAVELSLAATTSKKEGETTVYSSVASFTVTMAERSAYLSEGTSAASVSVGGSSYSLTVSAEMASGVNASSTENAVGAKADEIAQSYDLKEINAVSAVTTGAPVIVWIGENCYAYNGAYRFLLELVNAGDTSSLYRLAARTLTGTALARYDELKGILFATDGASLSMLRLTQKGSGEIISSGVGQSFNGGYIKKEAGYLFVDEASFNNRAMNSNWDAVGVTLISGRVVAVFPDGSMTYVAVELHTTGGVEEAVISVAPGMRQMRDTYGQPVYSKVKYGFYQLNGKLVVSSEAPLFFSTGNDDLYAAMLEKANLHNWKIGYILNGDGSYIYDETSDPVYELHERRTDDGGKTYLYRVEKDGEEYLGERVISYWTYEGYVRISVKDGYASISDRNLWLLSGMRAEDEEGFSYGSYTFTPVYDYLAGTVVLVPTGSGANDSTGATVTYIHAAPEFSMTADANGYKIVSRYVRVVDADTADRAGLPIGTLLYLNKKYEIAAYLMPDGTFRVYTDGSVMGDTDAIYSEYVSDGENGLNVTISPNTPAYLLELIGDENGDGDLYVSFSGFDGRNYENADYFGYVGGMLTKLSTGYAEYKHVTVNSEKRLELVRVLGEGETIAAGNELALIIYDGNGDALLSIISNSVGGTAIFILSDGSTVDSDMNFSAIVMTSSRNYHALDGESAVAVGSIEASSLTLKVNNPAKGSVKLINLPGGTVPDIKADSIDLDIAGNVNIFTQNDPLTIAPKTEGGTAALRFSGGAYAGEAYIKALCSLAIANSVFGAKNGVSAHVSAVAEGDVSLSEVTVEAGAVLSLAATGGAALHNMLLKTGTLNLSAATNILLDRIELIGAGNVLVLTATGGGIYASMDGGYLFADSIAAVKLFAHDDVGSKNRYIFADIPAAMQLYIERVASYYLKAAELTGTSFARVYAAPDVVSGEDEAGIGHQGDYLGDGGEEALMSALKAQTPEELAAWVLQGGRGKVNDLLGISVLAALIESGNITQAILRGFVVDSAFTQAQLQALLADVSVADRYEQVAARLHKALLGESTASVSDAQAAAWLAAAISAERVIGLKEALTGLLTEEQIIQLIQNAKAKAAYTGTPPSIEPARGFDLRIGTSTGTAYVENEGDIAITQEHGDLTVGLIGSVRGDVTLRALAGSIIGAAGEGKHIYAHNISLTTPGGVGTGGAPLITDQRENRPVLVGNVAEPVETGGVYAPITVERVAVTDANGVVSYVWALKVLMKYAWIRVEFPEEAARTDASAGSDIYLSEFSGDMGVGVISAGGNTALYAPGSIVDMRTAEQRAAGDKNVTANGVLLDSAQGGIGALNAPLSLAAANGVRASAYGNIHLSDTGNMDLIVESETGRVYASAEDDLTMVNVRTRANSPFDLLLGLVTAGDTAHITALGGMFGLGTAANVAADSIALTALNGTIGTTSSRLNVDTGSGKTGNGTLLATGMAVYIGETSGDLHLLSVSAGGDIEIYAPGGIYDDGSGRQLEDAYELQRAAAVEARNAADAAQANADVLKTHADRLEQAYLKKAASIAELQKKADEAKAQVDGLKQRIADTEADATLSDADRVRLLAALNEQLVAAQKQQDAHDKILADAKEEELLARQAMEAARKAADDAQTAADSLYALANSLQAGADSALVHARGVTPTVSAGGNLLLSTPGSIGASTRGLTFAAGGLLTALAGGGANDNIYLAGAGGVRLALLRAGGMVNLVADGNITQPGSGASVVAGSAGLHSLSGGVGTPQSPVFMNVGALGGMAMGGGFHVNNAGALQINNIYTSGDAGIAALGAITAGSEGGLPNVTANGLTLTSGGAIGASGSPLMLLLHGRFTATGANLFLGSLSHLDIASIRGNDVNLESAGTVAGGPIYARSLVIEAKGDIGSKERPLIIVVPGKAEISTDSELINYLNLYGAEDTVPVDNSIAPRTGGAPGFGGLLCGLALLMGLCVLLRRRYSAKRG